MVDSRKLQNPLKLYELKSEKNILHSFEPYIIYEISKK